MLLHFSCLNEIWKQSAPHFRPWHETIHQPLVPNQENQNVVQSEGTSAMPHQTVQLGKGQTEGKVVKGIAAEDVGNPTNNGNDKHQELPSVKGGGTDPPERRATSF
mmetsp:Transcript_22587/g.49029  ORF Transcript_22587/g.49029 Transcript_22587/m.49029 type:complete len:106 (+) Transcript_22587:1580-1897(+)